MPRPLQPPGSADPEQMKKLAALGYISASTADLTKKDLPAPRDRIGAVAQLKAGFGALQAGRYADAVAVFGKLLKTEPGMTDVWQMYGEACMKLGREDEALAALLQAAKLAPLNPQVMMALSDYYLAVGNYEEARKHAEAAGDSGTTSPHENLARIALVKGDLDAAERESRAALEKYPMRRIPHLMIARARHDRGDYPGALAELDLAARPSKRRRHAAPEPELPAGRQPGAPRPRGGSGEGVSAGDPRLSGQRRRRGPPSPSCTRARAAKPTRARPSPTSCASSIRPRPILRPSRPTRSWATPRPRPV